MAMHIEDIIEETGGCGRFQIIVSFAVHFAKGIMCFTIIFMMFGGLVPDWWCLDDMDTECTSQIQGEFNDSLSIYKSCGSGKANATRSCQRLVFDSSVRTIVSEWNLVCESTWIISTITSIQMAGLVVGNTLGGHSADIIGRKPTFLGTLVVNTALNATIIFSPSWIVFAIFRFFMGVASGIQLTVMYSIQCEFAPTQWRSFIVAAPSWPLLMSIFALLCWLLQDWRHVHIAITVFGAVSIISCWFVQESFRWRVAHGQIDKAYKIVKFVAKVNNRPPPTADVMEALADNLKQAEETEWDRKYSFLDLIRTRILLKYTLLLSFVWFSIGISVDAIQFGMSAISGSFYTNVVIYAAITLPFMLLIHFLQNSIGRRKTLAVYLLVFTLSVATAAIAYIIKNFDSRNTLTRICSLLAVSVLVTSFTTIQTMTLELYPTVVRNIGYGWQNTMSKVGSVVGPQLAFLESMFPGMMFIVCSIFGIVSIVMVKLLPETRGISLQDNLHEVRGRSSSKDRETSNDSDTGVKNSRSHSKNSGSHSKNSGSLSKDSGSLDRDSAAKHTEYMSHSLCDNYNV